MRHPSPEDNIRVVTATHNARRWGTLPDIALGGKARASRS